MNRLKRRTALGLTAGFAVLVAVLVVFGVLYTREPGLIDQVPQWKVGDFPLRLCATTYPNSSLSSTHKSAVQTTISWINKRLGGEYFTYVKEKCTVEVQLDAPIESGWRDPGGHSALQHSGAVATKCLVETGGTAGAGDLTLLVLYHELGHCLGLAHDESASSIMSPVQVETPDGAFPPWFSDADRSLIRKLYPI